MTIKYHVTEEKGEYAKNWLDTDTYPPTYHGGYSYKTECRNLKGKEGNCNICQIKKFTIVNDVCLDCTLKKGKYIGH